jgi:hypothetical protein
MNNEPETPPVRPTVFLSYASEDRPAARLLGAVLPNYGLEVWYDESELGGGDAWDQKIRRQIRECDYFMPLISEHTEARHEGYFRREWRLAVERTLDMADDHLFLLPVVIDATDESRARVPEKFLAVQWLRLPGGQTSPALEALCRRLAVGDPKAVAAPRRAAPPSVMTARAAPEVLHFPEPEPGHRMRFWFEVAGWALRSAWGQWRRLRPWLRVLIIIWLAYLMLTRGCATRHHETDSVSPATAARLKALTNQYQGAGNPADAAKLAAQIAHEIVPTPPATPGVVPRVHILVIPFAAGNGAAADAGKLADAALAQVYGRIAIRQGQHLGMAKDSLSTCDLAGMLERGREVHSEFVVCGTTETQPSGPVLTVRIASGTEKAFMWSKSYPVQGTDPATVANEVDAKLAALEDD